MREMQCREVFPQDAECTEIHMWRVSLLSLSRLLPPAWRWPVQRGAKARQGKEAGTSFLSQNLDYW